jgi:hypothetical protein
VPNPSYADLALVKVVMGVYGVGLTATSVPSQNDVTNLLLPDVSGQIDRVLSGRAVVVPVTAPGAFLDALKLLNARGVAAQVIAVLFPQAAGPASTTLHTFLEKLFEDGLQRLRTDELPEGLANNKTVLPRSFATSHPDSFSSDFAGTPGNEIDPVFRRDRQW